MRGNPLRKADVRPCYEIESTAAGAFLVKKLQQGAVVGQMRDVERDMGGDESLEGGLAVQQASGQSEQPSRMRARQHKQRVHESVGLDQSSVEIDTKGSERCCGSFRQRDNLGQTFTSAKACSSSCIDDKTVRWVGGWNGGILVELSGIEPLASSLRTRRSPS